MKFKVIAMSIAGFLLAGLIILGVFVRQEDNKREKEYKKLMEYDKKYKHRDEVRRRTLGLLQTIDINLITESGYSYPSGHSMMSMAFYGLLIYFAYKYIKNKKLKYTICTLLGILIISICIR